MIFIGLVDSGGPGCKVTHTATEPESPEVVTPCEHHSSTALNNGSTKTYFFAVTKKLFPSIKPQKNT